MQKKFPPQTASVMRSDREVWGRGFKNISPERGRKQIIDEALKTAETKKFKNISPERGRKQGEIRWMYRLYHI